MSVLTKEQIELERQIAKSVAWNRQITGNSQHIRNNLIEDLLDTVAALEQRERHIEEVLREHHYDNELGMCSCQATHIGIGRVLSFDDWLIHWRTALGPEGEKR